MLKFIITLTSIQLSLAFTAVIFVFTKDFQVSGAMHILVLVLPPMVIKIAFSEFRNLFLRILRSQFLLPEHSIHYSLLLEQLLIDEKVSIIKDQTLFPSKESMIGTLADKNIFVDENKTTIEILPLYQHIVEKLEQVHYENPKCWVLSLYLSQLHLEKLDNKARAMEMVRKLEDLNLFLPTKSSIEYVFSMIEDKHMKESFSAEDAFGLSSYFKYYDLTNSIKHDMLEETKMHLRIWEDLHKNNLEVKRLVERAESIDFLFNKIQRQYKLNFNNFRKNFTSPILLYSVYLNNIRETQAEGFQVLKNFQLLMNSQSGDNAFDTISGTTALLIISLDKAKAGQILDASGSIQSLFNYKKADLVGQKLGIIFPSMIAKDFQRFFNDFCKAPSSDLDYKDRTFAKTHTDEIFEIDIMFKLYPYTNKEMTVLILLKKASDPLPALIAGPDGVIIDCSRMLKKEFHKENADFSVHRSLKNMNTDLEEVNNAFNIGYSRKENKTNSLRGSIREKSGGGSAAVSAAQSYFDSEDITTTRYSNRSLIKKTDAVFDKIRDDWRPTKQASQEEVEKAQQLCEGYIQGKKLRLWANRFSEKRKERFSVHAQIKPLVCEDNHVYKVMILGNLKKDEEISDDYTEESARELSAETFADEFPMANEKVHLHATSYNTQKSKRHERSSGRITTIISSRKEPKKKKQPKASQNKGNKLFEVNLKLDRMTPRDDQRSSAMSSAYQENKIVKTIKDIGSKQRLNSSLFSLHVLLYLIIIFLLCLAGTKYNLSTDSINEIKSGIYIINTSSRRLLSAINAWQWSLVLWASISTDSFDQLTPTIRESAQNLSYYNDELKKQMFVVHNKDLQDRAFREDIKLWQLEIEGDDNLMVTNTFIATDILTGKYIEVSKSTSLFDLVNIPDFFEIYNNTGNDYIISSNALISDIDNIIQDRISKDISLLKAVLGIEVVFLLSIIVLFILMAWIISRSYYRLCRTIARTGDFEILQRIDLLHKTRDYLEDDIERKSFIQDSFDSFIDQKPTKNHAKESAKTGITYRTKEFDMRDLNKFLLKRALLALVLMPVLIGLFIGTLVKSINTFYSLAGVNDQISILSEGCYETNVAMSHQIYATLFQSTAGMLLNNHLPFDEASKTLEKLNNLNTQLIDIFLTQPEEVDPLIKDILQTNTCDYLDEDSKELCYFTTNDQKMGLLSLNTDYYNTLYGIKVALGNNTSYLALILLLGQVLGKVIGEMSAFEKIYPYLITHVLEKFAKTTESSKHDELTFFIIILVLITVYAAFIFWKPLKDLRKTDIGRRKVIKIIPLHIMQENKGFKFYLMQDFKKEVDDIRSII